MTPFYFVGRTVDKQMQLIAFTCRDFDVLIQVSLASQPDGFFPIQYRRGDEVYFPVASSSV